MQLSPNNEQSGCCWLLQPRPITNSVRIYNVYAGGAFYAHAIPMLISTTHGWRVQKIILCTRRASATTASTSYYRCDGGAYVAAPSDATYATASTSYYRCDGGAYVAAPSDATYATTSTSCYRCDGGAYVAAPSDATYATASTSYYRCDSAVIININYSVCITQVYRLWLNKN